MDWRLKVVGFQIFNNIPLGDRLHYWFQKHVTKSLPRENFNFDIVKKHITAFNTYGQIPLSMVSYFEFGGGWDLFVNILNYCYGINKQIVVDIKPLLKVELVNHVIGQLQRTCPIGCSRSPEKYISTRFKNDLLDLYGIKYIAPQDARKTNLAKESIDFVSSTNTLEHIPEQDIILIMRELYRICHKDSIVSLYIDYTDHYQHGDNRISNYNFLSYGRLWSLANPSNHFQNRLRHIDFRNIFESNGFKILSESKVIPDGAEELLGKIRISKIFKNYSNEELYPVEGHFVLKKDL